MFIKNSLKLTVKIIFLLKGALSILKMVPFFLLFIITYRNI